MGKKELDEIKKNMVKNKNSNPRIDASIREIFGGIDPYNARKITVYQSNEETKNQSGEQKPSKRNSKGRSNLLKRIVIGGMVGAIGVGAVSYCNDSNSTASLDDVLQSETPDSLGIPRNTKVRLDELNSEVNGCESAMDEIVAAGNFIELKRDIIKSKLVNAFDILGNPIDTSDIALIPEQVGENSVQIAIDGIGIYEYKEEEEGKEQKNTISYDIAHYVTDIVEMQGCESDLKNGVERSDFKEKAKESLDKTDKFAAGKIKVDENGNITIKMKTKAELLREEIDREAEDDEYDR